MRSSLKLLTCLAVWALASGPYAVAKSDKTATPAPASTDKKKDDKKKKADPKKGDDKKKDPKKKGDDPADPADPANPADPNAGPKLNLPLVKAHPSFGLKIPYTDANGKLQMIYYIGEAVKVDDNTVEMKDTKVETYNDEGEVEMTVDLPVSQLDLSTKVVSSKTETTIKREDFIITGDSVKFNTVKKQAALVGHVHMIVYDNDDAATPPADTATPPVPAPSTNE